MASVESFWRFGHRKFREFFGTSPALCVVAWDLLADVRLINSKPNHLLWALMLLKRHCIESLNAALVKFTEKSFRKWSLLFVDLLADMQVLNWENRYRRARRGTTTYISLDGTYRLSNYGTKRIFSKMVFAQNPWTWFAIRIRVVYPHWGNCLGSRDYLAENGLSFVSPEMQLYMYLTQAKGLLLIEVTETKLFSTFPMETKMMNKREKFSANCVSFNFMPIANAILPVYVLPVAVLPFTVLPVAVLPDLISYSILPPWNLTKNQNLFYFS
ncbi:hypothetical protein DAPPUDRAFT_322882 [Daphnia pulex]|uniref:Uncharacterized protein n=1 Tax=Daphnia pulex TaxID=6669 RepID=E9GX76_DAPPU|nr:hypothetical protein DAPPUDRAFT_322882 [Daphnia pulex]|eukprot:EFX75908.1 hypothetical protein DAPPUDRAFT_322882 [Daphnia pulex]